MADNNGQAPAPAENNAPAELQMTPEQFEKLKVFAAGLKAAILSTVTDEVVIPRIPTEVMEEPEKFLKKDKEGCLPPIWMWPRVEVRTNLLATLGEIADSLKLIADNIAFSAEDDDEDDDEDEDEPPPRPPRFRREPRPAERGRRG